MRPLRTTINVKSLKLIGIPKSFLETTLDDYIADTEDLQSVKTFVGNYIDKIDTMFRINSGIFFNGSNGVGKTMLSCIVAKEAYRHRYTTRRCTFVDYMNQYTKAWGAKSAEEKETFEDNLYTYYKAVEFLILDEVGKEVDSKVSAPILEDLLRYREDKGYVTIICTNLNIDTLKEKYGNSCISLLKGNCTPIIIESNDLRNQVFKEKNYD